MRAQLGDGAWIAPPPPRGADPADAMVEAEMVRQRASPRAARSRDFVRDRAVDDARIRAAVSARRTGEPTTRRARRAAPQQPSPFAPLGAAGAVQTDGRPAPRRQARVRGGAARADGRAEELAAAQLGHDALPDDDAPEPRARRRLRGTTPPRRAPRRRLRAAPEQEPRRLSYAPAQR